MVVVAPIVGQLATQPLRPHESLVDGGQFDLGDDQSGIVAGELVDLPDDAVALDVVPDLLQPADAQRLQQFAGLADRLERRAAA